MEAFGGITFALIVFALAIAFIIAVFLVIRSLVLWYWKIDQIVKNQEEQIFNQTQLTDAIRRHNELIEKILYEKPLL